MKKLYITITVLILLGCAQYCRVFSVPPDGDLLYQVKYPLMAGTYDSLAEWAFKDIARTMRFIRPVPLLVQGVVVTLLEKNDFVLHLISFVSFILVSLLVFLLLRKENVKFGLALLGGVIIIIHPINAINVTKPIHLMDLFGTMFFLIALNLYVSYRDKPKSKLIYFVEWLFIVLMVFSYELFVVAPVLLVIYEFFIKARGKLREVNIPKLLPSLAIWSLMSAVYLTIRFIVFRGIGGYQAFGEANPISPFLKGAKWLSGFGFLHFSGQPLGWLDFVSVLALILLFAVTFLRKSNFRFLVFAFCWFVGATLPFYLVTATYYYVFALSLIGIVVALILTFNQLSLKSLKMFPRALLVASFALIAVIWSHETRLGVADVADLIDKNVAAAQKIYDRFEDKQGPVVVFLATEKEDPQLQRLVYWHYPDTVEIKNILPGEKSSKVNELISEDQTSPAIKIYAWRRGDTFTFYPSLEALLKETEDFRKMARIRNSG